MRTEEEIIYTIWDTVRAGEMNQDDTITERLLRSYLKSHRGKHLGTYYDKGVFVEDECFQDLPEIIFSKTRNEWISAPIPKIIRLSGYGVALSKDNYPIQVVDAEEFRTSQTSRHNKWQPKVKFVNGRFSLYMGQEQACDNLYQDFTNSPLNTTVKALIRESRQTQVKIQGRAVLVDPDDSPGYDFTSSAYPFPDELLDSLINSVTARDFNMYLQVRSDETTDNRDNNSEKNTREEF